MGTGIRCKCHKCGYSHLFSFGIGFSFPEDYNNVMTRMEKGEFGEFCQKFLIAYPDGAVDYEYVALQCPKCCRIDNDIDLTMYIPKNNYKLQQHKKYLYSRKYKYLQPYNIDDDFQKFAKNYHICPSCNRKMRLLDEAAFRILLDKRKLKCPQCGSYLVDDGLLLWD